MGKKQIVFLEGYSTINLYKISREFMKRGYKTVLIRLLKPSKEDENFFNDGYNQIIDVNLSYFQLKLKNLPDILFSLFKNIKILFLGLLEILRLKPYVIIGRATPSWPTAFFRVLFRKTPIIYFPMDIRTLFYPDVKMAKEIGGISNFEIKSERFCFERTDGLIYKNDPNELNFINGRMLGDNVKLPELKLNFHPYCSDEFIAPLNKNKLSKTDGKMHVVYPGSSGTTNREMYIKLFEGAKEILKQKIHYHVYVRLNTESKENIFNDSFLEDYKKLPYFSYFHVHEGLNPKEIVKEISKYDFGLYPPFNPDAVTNYNLDFKGGIGNKISTYLEAGIPLFISENYSFMCKLMKKYNIYFPLTTAKGKNDLKNLKKLIKKVRYRSVEKKILKAREDFNIQKHFSELEEFVKKVAEKKR